MLTTYMMLILLKNKLLVYIAKYDDDYVWCHVIWSWTSLVIPCWIYLAGWGYGTSLDHCSCKFSNGLWVIVLHMLECYEILYMFYCGIRLCWSVLVITAICSYTWWLYFTRWYWSCIVYGLFLINMCSLVHMLSWFCTKDFQSKLACF